MAEPRPRLLVVITLAEVGGAQTYVASLLPALAERYDVTLAAHGTGPLVEVARANGIPFVPLQHVRRPVHPGRDLLGLVELMRLFRRVRPDIVHLNSSKAGILGSLAAALTGVRIRVFTVNGWAFFTFDGWLRSRILRRVGRLIRVLATQVICVSHEELRRGLAAETCRPDRSVVIHNAVDVHRFRPGPGSENGRTHLISVGRLQWPKDFITFAGALRRLPRESFEALVVGDGPDREKIAETANGVLELAGNRDDVPELLAVSDAFVLSTTSEGLPLAVLEAMAAGLPVVASAVGGVPELVADGETGFLVPSRDEEALGEALGKLIADPDLRRRMGSAGRARAEAEFDLPAFQQAHLDLYERLLVEYRSRR